MEINSMHLFDAFEIWHIYAVQGEIESIEVQDMSVKFS